MYLGPQMRLAALGQQGLDQMRQDLPSIQAENIGARASGPSGPLTSLDSLRRQAIGPVWQNQITADGPVPGAPYMQDQRARVDIAPPIRPGGMENLSGSLGGQIRPSPYSAPQMPQMGGGFGGGQGMQQFMQFMQTMMQMFQQFQGGGGRGMGGGFQGPSPFMPQQQQYGQYQPRRMSNQFNSNNAFGGY